MLKTKMIECFVYLRQIFFLFYFQEEQGIAAVPKQVSFIAALFKSTSGNPAENSTDAG